VHRIAPIVLHTVLLARALTNQTPQLSSSRRQGSCCAADLQTAMYEIVLVQPSGRTDVRVSEEPPPLEHWFEIDRVRWKVVRVEQPAQAPAGPRYVCERVRPLGRATKNTSGRQARRRPGQ
jgi:hypothetical protein